MDSAESLKDSEVDLEVSVSEEDSPRISTGRFEVEHGYMTLPVQTLFLKKQIEAGRLPASCLDDPDILSLEPSNDPEAPLFWWQIFRVAGRPPIQQILTNFYNRVFHDEEAPWFRNIFEELSDMKYHVAAQSLMWLDCFGGGRLYGGAQRRLDIHHHDTMASELMHYKGAKRWRDHMVAALDEETQHMDAIDPRLRIGINTFLTFFMEKYAGQFKFDGPALVFGETYPRSYGESLQDSSSEGLSKRYGAFFKQQANIQQA